MMTTDECPVLICGVLQLLISSPLFITVIFLDGAEAIALYQNNQQRSHLSNMPSSTNIHEQLLRLKAESVPSEFPASPQPMSNGTNVYVPPIIYLKKLVNQTNSEFMMAINYAFNASKLENRTLPHDTTLTKKDVINNAHNVSKIPTTLSSSRSSSFRLASSTTEKPKMKQIEDFTINRKNANNHSTYDDNSADAPQNDSVPVTPNQYYDVTPLILISLALTAVICLYGSLIIFRRILEKQYGNREILLQEEYLDNNDDFCYIHEYIQENSLCQ